jgi:glycyl-tRNA synthetase
MKVPFGIAQIGKAFRNEISPRDFIFRVRELEQFEIEYFVNPKQDEGTLDRFKHLYEAWFERIGLAQDKLVWHHLDAESRAHYSSDSWDVEYKYFGNEPKELGGIANRTDYDLSHHIAASGKDLSYFDPATNERFTPHVIEPTMGAGRTFLAVMDSAYCEEQVSDDTRIMLKFKPEIAPVKAAILPLSKKPELSAVSEKLYTDIVRATSWNIEYDDTQSIGKRYRRQDEIGTPYCVTIDFDTLTDNKVTIRDRDSMQQQRVAVDDVLSVIKKGVGDGIL